MVRTGSSIPSEHDFRHIWKSPLVPVALAWTAGILSDRIFILPLVGSCFATVVLLVAWVLAGLERRSKLPLLYLLLAILFLGAAYHHWRRHTVPRDDVSFLVRPSPRPSLLRGELSEDLRPVGRSSFDDSQGYLTRLDLSEARIENQWRPISGSAQLLLYARSPPAIRSGDRVEVIGQLQGITGPENPGEPDFASLLADRGIRARITVPDAERGLTRLEARRAFVLGSLLSELRDRASRVLREHLSPDKAQLAEALLLGRMRSLPEDRREAYRKSGVVHVLVISGQHFLVLSLFVQGALRLFGIHLRPRAATVSLLMIGYALMVGLRPPVLRATVTLCSLSVGVLLLRRVWFAHAFAMAWIVVLILNPTEVVNPGCQLSFLAVAVLYWMVGPLRQEPEPDDGLARLVEESRPLWQRIARRLLRSVGWYYLACLIVWLCLLPRVASISNLLPFSGLLIGPPVMLLISLALIGGFCLLLTALIPPLAAVFAVLTELCLGACEGLVDWANGLPFGYRWVSEIPDWWLLGFYGGLIVAIMAGLWERWRGRCLLGAAGWLCLGLLVTVLRPSLDELRVTVLSVGDGCCTVIETPQGRTLLYDVGSLGDPDAVRRRVAPFLRHRGITRIDEVILSHAHADHYNGMAALMERFSVGQVTCNPTFLTDSSPEVRNILAELRAREIPVRAVRAGQRLTTGSVTMDVLHPPADFIAGSENARSLVLLLTHERNRILLTGDLAEGGLTRFLQSDPQPVDVLMAPHHGSAASNTEAMAKWAKPRVVIASRGRESSKSAERAYRKTGARYLSTKGHGAVTIHSHSTGLVVRTFRAREMIVLRRASPRR